jgi:hypothetical protein
VSQVSQVFHRCRCRPTHDMIQYHSQGHHKTAAVILTIKFHPNLEVCHLPCPRGPSSRPLIPKNAPKTRHQGPQIVLGVGNLYFPTRTRFTTGEDSTGNLPIMAYSKEEENSRRSKGATQGDGSAAAWPTWLARMCRCMAASLPVTISRRLYQDQFPTFSVSL